MIDKNSSIEEMISEVKRLHPEMTILLRSLSPDEDSLGPAYAAGARWFCHIYLRHPFRLHPLETYKGLGIDPQIAMLQSFTQLTGAKNEHRE